MELQRNPGFWLAVCHGLENVPLAALASHLERKAKSHALMFRAEKFGNFHVKLCSVKDFSPRNYWKLMCQWQLFRAVDKALQTQAALTAEV